MSESLVVIGNGMAAARLVEELCKRALGRYAIAVVGDEPRIAYNRVLLSALLAEEIDSAAIELKPARWWRDRGVTLRYGSRATAVDPVARVVTLADGTTLSFSKLVFATGSHPIKLAAPGIDLPGVSSFRDVDDASAIRRIARRGARVVVVGGGLLGLEAAYGIAKAGAQVTVVHLMDRLMERQLDEYSAAMLREAVEAKGIAVLLNAQTTRIAGPREVTSLVLEDGRVIPADAVVIAIGIRPNAALAKAAGLDVQRGIVIDDRLETSTAGIYAIGECAEHRGTCYGLVEPAHEQAQILARRLAGETVAYRSSVLATNLKVAGIDVFSAGTLQAGPGQEEIVLRDAGLRTYRKLVIARDRLIGAVLFGDTGDGSWYSELIRSGSSIDRFRADLVFGRATAEQLAA